jgi:ActR/RegA family two-component response regulator
MSNVIDLYKKLSDLEFCSKLERIADEKHMNPAAGQAAANQKWEHLQLVFERCHEYYKPATKHNKNKVG